MSERLIEPPAALAVSMDAARRAARVDVGPDGTSPLDDDIARAVKAYTRDAEHATGRAFIYQTWRVTLDAFPDAFKSPKGPLDSVKRIGFCGVDGSPATLDPKDYLVDVESTPGYVVPAPGCAWPATAGRIGAVEADVVCGYGPDDTFVPDEAKEYILARVQMKFSPVGTVTDADFDGLLDGLRIY